MTTDDYQIPALIKERKSSCMKRLFAGAILQELLRFFIIKLKHMEKKMFEWEMKLRFLIHKIETKDPKASYDSVILYVVRLLEEEKNKKNKTNKVIKL